jgi:hypothetical protein
LLLEQEWHFPYVGIVAVQWQLGVAAGDSLHSWGMMHVLPKPKNMGITVATKSTGKQANYAEYTLPSPSK